MPSKLFHACGVIAALLGLLPAIALAHDTDVTPVDGFPQVLVTTTQGEFVIELETTRAPVTSRNFLRLVESGYYKNSIFHRVMRDFVVQGGGHGRDYAPLPGVPDIINESGNGLSNQRGTIAMARGDAPHSASSQFYVNVVNNEKLDPRSDRWGYTVFGHVTEGMDTIDAISVLPTGSAPGFAKDVPAMPVVVRDMRVLSQEEIDARMAAELEAAKQLLESLEE
ncbi:MAG: peptidylprolyl isomerase [Pseudomonadota bacterium]